MDLATAAATMIITVFGNAAPAVTSMPVTTMQECRKNMVAYVEELADFEVVRKSQDAITVQGTPISGTIRVIAKCQTRNPQS